MHAEKPSLTAAFVSFFRGAVSSAPEAPCFDPLAKDLVPAPFASLLRAMEGAPHRRKLLEPLVRALSLGLVAHIELRTAIIDEALREAVASGVRQLVVLGAGLDARAWRIPDLGEVEVWEIDHPATQRWKRERTAGRTPRAKRVTLVPVDFEKTSLREALESTAHDSNAPTFWIWEGVTMYLNPPAMLATLKDLSARSATGSRMAVTYLTPEVVASMAMKPLARPTLRLIREPLHGIVTPEEMARRVSDGGFTPVRDVLPAEEGTRFGRSTSRWWVSPSERVLIAERR